MFGLDEGEGGTCLRQLRCAAGSQIYVSGLADFVLARWAATRGNS